MLSCSNGTVVIATAMVCSSTALFLVMARQFHGNHDHTSKINQIPRPILRSEVTRKQQKKKKKVRFADNMKDTKGNGKEYRMRKLNRRTVPVPLTNPEKTSSSCRTSSTMLMNQMTLYNGIFRDRHHRIQGL